MAVIDSAGIAWTALRAPEVAISLEAEHESASGKAARATRKAANSKHAEALARFGLSARGAIYIVMGLLTLGVANGERKEVDQSGALREVLHQPLGTLLVVLLAIGFAGYSLWRFSEALFGVTGHAGSTWARVVSAFRGLVYAVLAFTAVAVLRGSQSSQADQQQGYAAEAMSHSWGQWAVGLVGAAVFVVGAFLAYEGLARKFMRYFPEGQLDAKVRSTIQTVGVIGNVARGAVFAGAGALVVFAAWNYEPSKAAGVDGTVQLLRDHSLTWLLVIAAAGLIAFGCYGLLEARYRRV